MNRKLTWSDQSVGSKALLTCAGFLSLRECCEYPRILVQRSDTHLLTHICNNRIHYQHEIYFILILFLHKNDRLSH